MSQRHCLYAQRVTVRRSLAPPGFPNGDPHFHRNEWHITKRRGIVADRLIRELREKARYDPPGAHYSRACKVASRKLAVREAVAMTNRETSGELAVR
jgi:hypothetical protein